MKLSILLFALLFCVGTSMAQSFKYDNIGRITEIKYSDSTVTQYAYDANGNRTSQITTTPVVTAVPNLDTNIAKLLVFPNPTPGTITVRLELRNPDNITISCYTLSGQLIFQERHKSIQTFTKSFQLDSKAAGIYQIVVATSKGKRIWKIEKF